MKYKLVLLLLTLSTGINAQLKLSDDEIEKLIGLDMLGKILDWIIMVMVQD